MKKIFGSLFLVTLLSLTTGCGENKSGVVLRVRTDTPGITPLEKPHRAATGDTDTFTNRTITPHSFKVAFTSFKLIEAQDPDDTNTPVRSYTVFERDLTNPIEVSLTSGQTVEVEENDRDPRQGTYNQIEYGIRYFEMTVPLCDTNTSCRDHRFRVYLTPEPDPDLSFTPIPGAILISEELTGNNFSWISPAVGLPDSIDLFPVTGTIPANPGPVLVPTSQFPTQADTTQGITHLFTVPLGSSLEIDNNPEEEFIFTLNFNLTDLFFYDNTDETNFDPGPTEFHFNALVDNIDVSRDGKIQNECTTDTVCRADFWPGVAVPTVTVEEEDRKD